MKGFARRERILSARRFLNTCEIRGALWRVLAALASGWGGMMKILLIEDNEMNRDMLAHRLERKGHEVVIAVDGQAGVNKGQSESPDVILMDLSLPVLDGWEATRILKSSPETRSIPIIALTAHAMSGDHAKALEAGCDDYDTKPVELPRLLEKIERVTRRKAAS